MLPLYTRWLSVEDYGITDIVTVYSSLLLSVITLCIAESIFIFPSDKDKNEQKEYFSTGFLFSLLAFILSGCIFFIIIFYLTNFGVENSFTNYGWYIYGIIFFSFFQKYFQQFSRAINKIKTYAFSGIILTACIALFSFILIPKFGVVGFIYAQCTAMFISGTYVFLSINGFSFFSVYSFKKQKCKDMLSYSIPLISNGVMWWLIGAFNRPLMEQYLGMREVGLYAVANKFPTLISVIFGVFILSWQISVLQEFLKTGYTRFYNQVARIVFFILAFASCFLTIFAKPIILLVTDDNYANSWQIVPILSIAALFASFGGFVGTNFSAAKTSKYYFYSSVWGGVGSVILNFLLIPKFGLYGAAFAFLGSYILLAMSRYIYSLKYVALKDLKLYGIFILINVVIYIVNLTVSDLILKSVCYIILISILLILNRDILVKIPHTINRVLKK